VWWGLWLVAAAGGAWWTIFGPAAMTFLLLKVSGVPLLEKGLEKSRPGYAEYARRTSAFIPWFPKA
jgi:steroid 5-alpha reductase family enzyme